MDSIEVKLPGLLQGVIECIAPIKSYASSYKETWEEIVICGNNSPDILLNIFNLSKHISDNTDYEPTVDVDDEAMAVSEISEYIDSGEACNSWKIILNKKRILKNEESITRLFFVDFESFKECLNKNNPFSPDCIASKYTSTKIFVNGLEEAFGTLSLFFLPLDLKKHSPLPWYKIKDFPEDLTTIEMIHILDSTIVLSPRTYIPSGKFSSEISKVFLLQCVKVMSACLASIIKNNEEITLKGIRHKDLELSLEEGFSLDTQKAKQVFELIKWAYEEKTETRLKLIRDRVSLELEDEKFFISWLLSNSLTTINQAKEEYAYVIADLRNEFEKGKRAFLSDLRKIASEYYERIRIITNGFLRDILALLFLLVLNLGSKIVPKSNAEIVITFSLLLKLLGFYLLFSIISQAIIALFEYKRLNKNAETWAIQTRSYLSEKSVKSYIREFTKGPRWFFWISMIIIIFIYLLLSYICISKPHYITNEIKIHSKGNGAKRKPSKKALTASQAKDKLKTTK